MPEKIDIPDTLRRLRRFYQQHKRPPSYEEIRDLFQYKSKNAAFWLVNQLVKKGLVEKDKKGKLLLDSLMGVRLLGSVQAGFPSPAEEELLDTLSLDEYLVRHPEQSFLVKVTGDSMVDAGIHEGDLVLVERGRQPKNNDIVIAQVDGSWTMKYYEKSAKGVRLVAANPKYQPIKPADELTVGGIVVAVIRRY